MAKKRKKHTVPAIKPADFGREVLKLLKQGWVQRTWAGGSNEEACDPLGEKARCWCLGGAILRMEEQHGVYPDFNRFADLCLALIRRQCPTVIVGLPTSQAQIPTSIPDWNDMPGRTKRQVLALAREAIKIAEVVEAAGA